MCFMLRLLQLRIAKEETGSLRDRKEVSLFALDTLFLILKFLLSLSVNHLILRVAIV